MSDVIPFPIKKVADHVGGDTIDAARAAFLADRKLGIGGSDVAAMLGIDPRKTPYQLWREKVGLDDGDLKQTPAMRRGKFLEQAAIARYLAKCSTIAEVQEQVPVNAGYMRGTIDARAVSTDGTRRVVEVKTVSKRVFRADWGEPWSDEVPDRALCQGLWYASLDAAQMVDYVVLVVPDDPDEVIGLNADEVVAIADLHIFQVPRNVEIEDTLLRCGHAFWHDHVVPRVAPPAMTAEDASILWPSHLPGKSKPVAPVLDTLKAYADISETARELDKERTRLREQLLIYAEDAEWLAGTNGPWLTLKEEKRAAYQVAASSHRTLRFSKWWNKARKEGL